MKIIFNYFFKKILRNKFLFLKKYDFHILIMSFIFLFLKIYFFINFYIFIFPLIINKNAPINFFVFFNLKVFFMLCFFFLIIKNTKFFFKNMDFIFQIWNPYLRFFFNFMGFNFLIINYYSFLSAKKLYVNKFLFKKFFF
jgi:hypothetical protein